MTAEFTVTVAAVTEPSSKKQVSRLAKAVRPDTGGNSARKKQVWCITVTVAAALSSAERREIRDEIFYQFDEMLGFDLVQAHGVKKTRWPFNVDRVPARDAATPYDTVISGDFIPRNARARMDVNLIRPGIEWRLKDRLGYKMATDEPSAG